MTDVLKFEAQEKTATGKSASKKLRNDNLVPAIVYGNNEPNLMICLPLNKFNTEYQKGGMKTKLVEITLNGKTITTLPKDIQLHPVTDVPEHIDLLRIGKDTIVQVAIVVKVLNSEKSPGIKKGGIVNMVHREILVNCHPSKIPHSIDIDISELEIGHNVHISQIKLPEGVTPVDKSDFTVISLSTRVEESETTVVPEMPGAEGAAAAPAAAAQPAADAKKK